MFEIDKLTKTKAKVITGRSAEELETNLNKFLSSSENGVEVVDTNSTATPGGVFYTLLYKDKVAAV